MKATSTKKSRKIRERISKVFDYLLLIVLLASAINLFVIFLFINEIEVYSNTPIPENSGLSDIGIITKFSDYDDMSLRVGDTITSTVTIVNFGMKSYENLEIAIATPDCLKIVTNPIANSSIDNTDKNILAIESLNSGENKTFDFEITVVDEGLHQTFLDTVKANGAIIVTNPADQTTLTSDLSLNINPLNGYLPPLLLLLMFSSGGILLLKIFICD